MIIEVKHLTSLIKMEVKERLKEIKTDTVSGCMDFISEATRIFNEKGFTRGIGYQTREKEIKSLMKRARKIPKCDEKVNFLINCVFYIFSK